MAVSFARAVWLFPLVYLVHVAEEYPRLVAWIRTNAFAGYTARDYLVVHLSGIALNVVVAALVSWFPNRIVVFLAFALVLSPGMLWNAVFHAGATVTSGEYCPGVLSGLFVYVPLFVWLARCAVAEQLLTLRNLSVALVIAAVLHIADVGHNIYRRW